MNENGKQIAHVTYKPAGRLGNVLYQMATVIGYAARHNLAFSAPHKTNDEFWNPIRHVHHLRSKHYNEILPKVVIVEKQHNFYELPFDESWRNKNIELQGYFQSFKYFDHVKPDILKLFAPFLPYSPLLGAVGIHVRRTDYLQYADKHIVQSEDYLREAVHFFVQNRYKTFVVASDDIRWCKDFFRPLRVSGAEFNYSEGSTDNQDLALLSCCEHLIGSSSTFSTWAYYLNRNPNKVAIFPEHWFLNNHGGTNTSDIVPPECLRMSSEGIMLDNALPEKEKKRKKK